MHVSHSAPDVALPARGGRSSTFRIATLIACLALAAGVEVRTQPLDATLLNAMVLIVANREGETLRGTGFIVALDRERSIATILTSAHVVEGAKFDARFAADPYQSPAPTELIRLEAENRNGLAVFRVRGAVPPDATWLEIAGRSDASPQPAQNLTLVGYPNTSETPLVRTRAFSGQDGALYLVDLGVGEGSSGGPVLLNGKVVGLVTATTAEQTYVVPFATLRTFLEGSRVPLATRASAPSPAAGGAVSGAAAGPPTPVPPTVSAPPPGAVSAPAPMSKIAPPPEAASAPAPDPLPVSAPAPPIEGTAPPKAAKEPVPAPPVEGTAPPKAAMGPVLTPPVEATAPPEAATGPVPTPPVESPSPPAAAPAAVDSAPALPRRAATDLFGAMVTVAGTVNGTAVRASGFVVSLHREHGASLILTSGHLAAATEVSVTFVADPSRPIPAQWVKRSTSTSGEGLLVLRVDSGVPVSASLIELAESVAGAPRPVELIASAEASAPPQVLERQFLGTAAGATFLLEIGGGVGPDFLGGPVLLDGKAIGVTAKSGDARATAFSAIDIRQLLETMELDGQPALPKR